MYHIDLTDILYGNSSSVSPVFGNDKNLLDQEMQNESG